MRAQGINGVEEAEVAFIHTASTLV